MVVHEWISHVASLDPLPELPRLSLVAVSRVEGPRYRFAGVERRRETGVLFQYTLSGCGALHDGRQEYRLTAGRGMLFALADPAYRYYALPDQREPWRVLWAIFEPGACGALIAAWNRRHGYVVTPDLDGAMVQRFLALGSGNRTLGAGEGAALVFDLLGACLGAHRPTSAGVQPRLIERALALIDRPDGRLPGVGELAAAVGVSREHLCRAFRARLGVAPGAAIRDRAIVLAQLDLRSTDLTVAEIGRRRGFSSAVRFGVVFRRLTGTTPGTYRARFR